MRLAQRLLLGSIVLVTLLVVAVVVLAGARLRDRLTDYERDELRRGALLAGRSWTRGTAPDSLADAIGGAMGRRVTLIDARGMVVGDSEFDGPALAALDNHARRPEVIAAGRHGIGTATRSSTSTGGEHIYVALPHPEGFVRMSISTTRVATIVRGAQRDVLVAGGLAFFGALVLAGLFARSVSRPVEELRDVAAAIAGGDLTARPAIAAPGEIGDLASALHQMADQLARRLTSMREDDALMTALVDSLNEGVLAFGPRGEVVRLNERARHFLRLTDIPPFGTERLPRNAVLREVVEAAMRGEAVEPMELQVFGQTLAVTARPLAAGGAVVALFDLTPLRRLETVRRDFVGNVSHELKTPLTVVRGFAETLMDPGISTDDRARFTEAIAANAERMHRIVDDLLDLSRIESGGWVPDPAWVNLDAVVTDTFTAVRLDADAKGLVLDRALHAPRIFADPTAIRQVVGNLVENAVRYTSEGRIVVETAQDEDGVRVTIRDTGIGIAAEHLPRIFERFYRVDRARARADGGTGLGLAIVKHLVEAHGGRAFAESVVGRGTAVSACFPDPQSA